MLTILAAGSGDGKKVAGLERVEKCCRLFVGEWRDARSRQDPRAFVSTLRFPAHSTFFGFQKHVTYQFSNFTALSKLHMWIDAQSLILKLFHSIQQLAVPSVHQL